MRRCRCEIGSRDLCGFKERGPQGIELERQIQEQLRRGAIRLIGPNCLGVMNPTIGLNATFAKDAPRPGNVAFLSQSGALLTAILDWGQLEQVGFSAIVSTGSMLDVGWGDRVRREAGHRVIRVGIGADRQCRAENHGSANARWRRRGRNSDPDLRTADHEQRQATERQEHRRPDFDFMLRASSPVWRLLLGLLRGAGEDPQQVGQAG